MPQREIFKAGTSYLHTRRCYPLSPASSLCLYQHVSFHHNYRAWLGGECTRRGTNWSCAISWKLSALLLSAQAPAIANCPYSLLSMRSSCSLITQVKTIIFFRSHIYPLSISRLHMPKLKDLFYLPMCLRRLETRVSNVLVLHQYVCIF